MVTRSFTGNRMLTRESRLRRARSEAIHAGRRDRQVLTYRTDAASYAKIRRLGSGLFPPGRVRWSRTVTLAKRMYKARPALLALLLTVSTWGSTLHAAAPAEFYLNLLRRGVAHVDTGLNDAAARELRIAAFGLVDSLPQFETAQVYLTV